MGSVPVLASGPQSLRQSHYSSSRNTRAIHGARATRRLWRSRLQSCKPSREAISGLRGQDAGSEHRRSRWPAGQATGSGEFASAFAFQCLRESHWVPAFAGMTSKIKASPSGPLTTCFLSFPGRRESSALTPIVERNRHLPGSVRQRHIAMMRSRESRSRRRVMKHRAFALLVLAGFSGLALGGCVVAPPSARVVAVAPARVWVPGHWHAGLWVRGHWRYR